MRRYSVLLATFMVLLLAAVPRLRALTDEEKQQEFLHARGDDSDSSPGPSPHHRHHPKPEPTPRHRHSPAAKSEEAPKPEVTPHHHHHSPTPGSGETPHHHHAQEESETPAATYHHPSPEPETTPRKPLREEEESATPAPTRKPESPTPGPAMTPFEERPASTPPPVPYQPYVPPRPPAPHPTAIPRATAAPTPAPGPWSAQVDIQKEGLEHEESYEPPPPPPVRHHWWQIFTGAPQPQYRFLTKSIRDAIDRAPVKHGRWRFIVVHNSGTRQGNARIFDYYHRTVRKMPNGLAYQFVIGNGTSSGNGQIEIGNRWVRQINGGHVHSDYLNNISLGICLVGDFNRDLPTPEQLQALDELIRYLRIRVGKIDGRPAIVKAHKEINPPQWPTDCPGDRFPYHWLHSRFG